MDDHTTLLEREVAPGVPGGSPVEARGQQLALDPERLERGDLLRVRVGSQGRAECSIT